jgi:purine-nucleoside phosphorylase
LPQAIIKGIRQKHFIKFSAVVYCRQSTSKESAMSIHIQAKPGDIAETVLLPGDPLRAKYIAENFLQDAVCYNEVRNMYGYTGYYQGKRVSIQGTGMGMPSMSIYAHELICEHGVKNAIRIGSAGAIQPRVKLRDIVLAMSTSTDSNMNLLRFKGQSFAPTADYTLLTKAANIAHKKLLPVEIGNVFTSDIFYDSPENWRELANHGVLGIEMEAAALYTIAARNGVRALAMLSISDQLVTEERLSPQDRQTSFNAMVGVALDLAAEMSV